MDENNTLLEETSKKAQIVAAYHIDSDLHRTKAADALDVSYEYIRQIFNDIEAEDPAEWRRLTEDDLETGRDPDLQAAVRNQLATSSALRSKNENQNIQTASSEPEPNTLSDVDDETITVPISELIEAYHIMEVLEREGDHEDNRGKEFVAREAKKRFEALLEDKIK